MITIPPTVHFSKKHPIPELKILSSVTMAPQFAYNCNNNVFLRH